MRENDECEGSADVSPMYSLKCTHGGNVVTDSLNYGAFGSTIARDP